MRFLTQNSLVHLSHRRYLSTISTVLSTGVGLLTALWTWKCTIMVLFQRKIIYMPYIPIGSRNEELDISSSQFTGIDCQRITISSGPKIKLAGLVLKSTDSTIPSDPVLVYFQGNAGNVLHRLPIFFKLLSASRKLHIVSVAPRSYWLSTRSRITEKGLREDARSIINYVNLNFKGPKIIYGHSIGSGMAIEAAKYGKTHGIILENAMTSIKDMVRAFYPSKWLPYHYLSPFVFDTWDNKTYLKKLLSQSTLKRLVILTSELDELVPPYMSEELWRVAYNMGIEDSKGNVVIKHNEKCLVVSRKKFSNALHDNMYIKPGWLQTVLNAITDVSNKQYERI